MSLARVHPLWRRHATAWGPATAACQREIAAWIAAGGAPTEELPAAENGGRVDFLAPRWAYEVVLIVDDGEEVGCVRYLCERFGALACAAIFAVSGPDPLVAAWETRD